MLQATFLKNMRVLLLQSAAEDAAHSRKDLHSGHMGFKALLEMGGASAQVTFMPDPQWHKHSTGSSKQRVRLRLPGEAALASIDVCYMQRGVWL
jgi:hypothetical protein